MRLVSIRELMADTSAALDPLADWRAKFPFAYPAPEIEPDPFPVGWDERDALV